MPDIGFDPKSMGQEMCDTITELGLDFARDDDVAGYFQRMSVLTARLTLPVVDPSRLVDAVRWKNTYALWNIVVDDEIDRTVSRHHLDESARVLESNGTRGLHEQEATGGGTLVDRLLSVANAVTERFREQLGTEPRAIMNGFAYEYLITKDPSAASSAEYIRWSTLTASIAHFLYADLSLVEQRIDPLTLRSLHMAYSHCGHAVKLASDIGTGQREWEDEATLNLPIILLMEEVGSDVRALKKQYPTYADLEDTLEPHRARTRALAAEHLRIAEEEFGRVKVMDMSGLAAAVRDQVDAYLLQDPFFKAPSNIATSVGRLFTSN